jgi:hypothetical protein
MVFAMKKLDSSSGGEEFLIIFNSLANVVLCCARILAPIFLFDVGDIYMGNDVVMDGHILPNQEPRALWYLSAMRYVRS